MLRHLRFGAAVVRGFRAPYIGSIDANYVSAKILAHIVLPADSPSPAPVPAPELWAA